MLLSSILISMFLLFTSDNAVNGADMKAAIDGGTIEEIEEEVCSYIYAMSRKHKNLAPKNSMWK